VLQTNDPPMGLHSPFTRKVVAPAMMILNALHKNDLIQADVVSRQLPRGLDWSLAVAKFLESKGV
jgi:pyrrolidone-carboxylate peptidase